MSVVMYGMPNTAAPWDPEEMRRRAAEIQREAQIALFKPLNFATKEDLAELRRVLETQMLALLGEVQRIGKLADKALAPKPRRRRKAVRR